MTLVEEVEVDFNVQRSTFNVATQAPTITPDPDMISLDFTTKAKLSTTSFEYLLLYLQYFLFHVLGSEGGLSVE